MDSATNDYSEFSSFSGANLRELFVEVDRELEADDFDAPCRIVIVGGAMIALRDSARVTGDVDVVSDGMPQSLRRAVELVAARHNLRPDWINDGAKMKTVALDARPQPVFEGSCLIVESASPRYVLAMKLVSARPLDEPDCVLLAQELGVSSVDELLDLVEEAVPWSGTLSVTTQYFAQSVFEKATAETDTSKRRGLLERFRSRQQRTTTIPTPVRGPQQPATGRICGSVVKSTRRRCLLPVGHKGRCRSVLRR